MSSDDEHRPSPDPYATDFASLKAQDLTDFVSLREAEMRGGAAYEPPKPRAMGAQIESAATDFASLKREIPIEKPRFVRRTVTDGLIAALSPILIFVMITAVIWFLLDVRFIYTEVNAANLRFTATLFILGIVALNRLIARDGAEESFLYIIGLGVVVVLYTLAITGAYDTGSYARDFLNGPFIATGLNLCATAFIWWFTNRLTHECCVDENEHAGDLGILTGTARRLSMPSARAPKLPDGVDEADLQNWARPYSERKGKHTPGDRLPRRHPGMSIFYFCVPVMALFALGQRVLLRGGDAAVMAGNVYVAVYTASALMLLMLTSLGGLRQYFRRRRMEFPRGISVFWVLLGTAMVAFVLLGALRLPRPTMPPAAYVGEHQYDEWSRDSTFKLRPLVIKPAEAFQQTKFQEYLGNAVIGSIALVLLYAGLRRLGEAAAKASRNREHLSPGMIRLLERIDATLLKVMRLPALPRLKPTPRVQRDIALSSRYTNPLGDPARASRMSNADLVAYTYNALCALATDMGVPRKPGQTPYEFVREFPKELKTLREETAELTDLLVRTNYAGQQLDDRVRDRLRRFWISYERIRGRAIR